MGLREPDCPISGLFSHTSPLSPPLKHPNLQRAEDVDALLLGMASQIAEREDHVVVEDVRGEAEAEAVPAGYAALAPGKKFSGSSRIGQGGMPVGGRRGMGNLHCLIADGASDLQTTAPSLWGWLGSQGWWEPGHEVQELPQTLRYLIPRFLAWATEVFPHRLPGQLPAPGPGSGPALLHQGQGNPGPASSYQMAGHQPSPLPE